MCLQPTQSASGAHPLLLNNKHCPVLNEDRSWSANACLATAFQLTIWKSGMGFLIRQHHDHFSKWRNVWRWIRTRWTNTPLEREAKDVNLQTIYQRRNTKGQEVWKRAQLRRIYKAKIIVLVNISECARSKLYRQKSPFGYIYIYVSKF